MRAIVDIRRIAESFDLLVEQFRESFLPLSFEDDFRKAKAVFIKPNLTYNTYKKGVTTRKEFVEALVAAMRGINDITKIYIGEGEGGYNSFSMTKAMRNMGFYDIERSYTNVEIVNVSELSSQEVELQAYGKPYPVRLPELFFADVDFSITCPVPKVHCMTGITLSFKNQWGCLPDTMRLKNHFVFDEIIGQVCEKLKFRYAFLDGKYGLNKNGPMTGEPVAVNWFAASNSLGAFDMVVSEMMGFDWRRIGHLKNAGRRGYLPDTNDIKIIGDLNALKGKFTLKRDLWNYPALAAFHSRYLTYFFYFSKLAKLLHDIMYTFRRRPID